MVLCVNNIASFQNGPKDLYLRDLITELGQATNLSICIDAADPRSYAGTGQTISDRSGNANDFYFGTTSSVEVGVDPSWNAGPTNNNGAGVADENTYFSIVVGTRIANVTNGAPASTNWFRNNGVVSAVSVQYMPTGAPGYGNAVFSTGDINAGTFRGGTFYAYNPSSTTNPYLSYWRTDGTPESIFSSFSGTGSSWNFYGYAFDEAAGTIAFVVNSSSETKSGVFSAATIAFTNQNHLSYGVPSSSGTGRVACTAVWNRALTTTELLSFYTQLKARRFPSLP